MGKTSNFAIFTMTLCILTLIVIVSSSIKINDIHEEKLIYAMHSKVEYFAERCYLENKCTGDITLSTLYEREYLTEVVDPVTKEIINYDTKISYINGNITIDWK